MYDIIHLTALLIGWSAVL